MANGFVYVGLWLAAARLTLGAPISFTPIVYPGAVSTSAYGIDTRGDIVGSYVDASSVAHGFLRSAAGALTSFDYPMQTGTLPGTVAYGINDAGTIVGGYNLYPYNAFSLDANGDYTSAPNSEFSSISENGYIAGFNVAGFQDFLIDPAGNYTYFTAPHFPFPPPGTNSFVWGVNDAGTVVGEAINGPGLLTAPAGFIRDASGHFTTFSVDNSPTLAFGINDNGVIVGTFVSSSDPSQGQGFVRSSAGAIQFVNIPGASDTELHGINDSGAMLGTATINGIREGFLIDPPGIPEPGTPLLIAFGLIALVCASWKRVPLEAYMVNRLVRFSLWMCGAYSAWGAPISFTPIVYPGAASTQAIGIDNRGDIVGAYTDAAGNVHGFIRSASGVLTSFDYPSQTPAAPGTVGFGINDSGQVVGSYNLVHSTAFSRDASGNYTTVSGSEFSAISGNGYIAGFTDAGFQDFIIDPAGKTTYFTPPRVLFPPPGTNSFAWGVNNAGVVVGDALNVPGVGVGPTAFIRDASGQFTTFTVGFAGSFTIATGINDNGVIVGDSGAGSFVRTPDGAVQFVNIPGASQMQLLGINDSGDMVGTVTIKNKGEGFLIDPPGIPEPGGLALTVLGLFALGLFSSLRNLPKLGVK